MLGIVRPTRTSKTQRWYALLFFLTVEMPLCFLILPCTNAKSMPYRQAQRSLERVTLICNQQCVVSLPFFAKKRLPIFEESPYRASHEARGPENHGQSEPGGSTEIRCLFV